MNLRKQSSTSYPITFLMVDSADHIAGKTGLTPTVTISKNGAAFGAPAGAVTEVGEGWYELAGNATDRSTLGDLLVHAEATGADPVDDRYTIVPWDPFDATALGLSKLEALDVSAVTQVAVSSAGHLTITSGLTFNESVSGLTIPTDWVSAIWTLKQDVRDVDSSALVQLRKTNPAAGTDGLQRLNGAAPASPITAASGTLTVNQAGGSITTNLTDELTALLATANDVGWDVKFIDANGDSVGRRGTADVVLTETKATA